MPTSRRRTTRRRARTLEQQRPLAHISRQSRGPLELLTSLVETAQLVEEIPTDARKKVIVLQRSLRRQPVDQVEPSLWSIGHSHGDRPIEIDDGRRNEPRKLVIEPDD